MAGEPQQWGIVASLGVALLGIARFLLRWEKTFSDAAREEIVQLRDELRELRQHIAKCEQDNAAMRAEIEALKRAP